MARPHQRPTPLSSPGNTSETESAVQREELLDAAARAKTFRDRQYALAEALLDAAERYLEVMDADDPDQMSFADACKALELASRLGRQPRWRQPPTPLPRPVAASSDQLTTLLEAMKPVYEAALPNTAPPPQPASNLLHSHDS